VKYSAGPTARTSFDWKGGNMTDEIDTFNKFIVAGNAGGTIIMNPPRTPMTKQEALTLAAWLVAMNDPGQEEFEAIFNAVCNC
jgi:hypothetical protein